ncbi:hypothetical protein A3H65_02430 [Candidatus Giovannonibacteria bacterium RIFCSPLOWO2_02_FULL_45_14]|uniref:Polymerase nucleotidyl transferase domain-containing protein n=1 Tax=Candidatus Giovannonibacteria bacterium RIFCSPLOWO2_12_FULL_44_15 TaxID=1798364 RepID=A0A1F5Y115_9BACT|nr:MAG: hypothetical protein A3C75_00165 [Candidatus Giovannonibacteria bacterium RIFCSPHIGHO2_02_FULL_44_31]OGF75931.1 MAG: hypothetical protein A3E62_00485 [Candidatus Giovannonibacteria bacterium RIFCSPHIGHO2_12_FULL_44_29]OGF91270.1 MAG: hypothetical protein A3H65_02430 [Candidatus Giovannonibacteria bacterium RIFCSPLOWO2_02_FULL_45_14]OGF93830.1 MAG: hypothetical protein A3G54_03655 [Candidatus Giovannonibacteria bacterium RIFCSPLOWO2_12_FULL_44_15]
MKYSSLTDLIEKMKSSPRVKGIFTTGTTASRLTQSSDIDLVVVIDKNNEGIKLVYTTIEKRFSDIFFFDIDFLNHVKNKQEVFCNNFDGMFLEWLVKGKIEYDPENLLSALKDKLSKNSPIQKVPDSEKKDFWVKVNYNYIANLRYYSGDDLYKKALEMRLLYSVSELISAYFSFRDISWRGEKAAVKYLEENDPGFLSIFDAYSKGNSLEDKMKHYEDLFGKIFFGEYQKWDNDFVIPVSTKNQYDPKLRLFWDQLAG